VRASLFTVLLAFAACGPAQRSEPQAPAPTSAPAPAPDLVEAPAPVVAVPAAATRPKGVAQVLVAEHNRYRAKHCAPPLAWSPELAAVAQKWADALKAKGCMFGHSNNSKYGENLAAGTTGAMPAEAVVAMWYDEVAKYSFKRPGFSMETGHFTQLVWTDTRSLGCGMAQCNGMDVWVCNYDPPGNWDGQYPEHVLPTSCKK
jgi:uncharacterized protein YkwD